MYSAVIVAAGKGSRAKLGYNKMLFKINGEAIIRKTVEKFVNNRLFNQVIVVINEKEQDQMSEALHGLDNICFAFGQGSRMDSVAQGVEKAINEVIFVHDGARIYITDELIARLDNNAKRKINCALATKAIDTTLMVERGKIKQILNRDQLFNMQTPQVVNKVDYSKSYSEAKIKELDFSDEMSMLTYFGYACEVVESEYYNIKLTKPEDFKEGGKDA